MFKFTAVRTRCVLVIVRLCLFFPNVKRNTIRVSFAKSFVFWLTVSYSVFTFKT